MDRFLVDAILAALGALLAAAMLVFTAYALACRSVGAGLYGF